MPADGPGTVRDLPVESSRRLIDFAEAPRVGDWSLRSALVRYAQVSPLAASAVLELLRRTEAALRPHLRALEESTVAEVDDAFDGSPSVAGLLDVAVVLDEIGDVLATWADARTRPPPHDAPPHDAVRQLSTRAFEQLAELGVPRETRPPRRAG